MAFKFLYILVLFTLFYSYIPNIAFTVGDSGIWSSDLIIISSMVVIFIKHAKRISEIWNTKYELRKYILYIFVLLSVPMLVGLVYNHSLTSIFRDSRSLFLCIIPFMFLLELNSYRKWHKFVKLFVSTLVITLFVFLFSYIFDIHFDYLGREARYVTEYGMIQQYGLPGGFTYYPFILFFTFVYLTKEIKLSFIKNRIVAFLLFVLSLMAIYYSGSRGYFFSSIFGLGIIILLTKTYLDVKVFLTASVGIILILFISISIHPIIEQSPLAQRYKTVLDGDDEVNIQLRTNALEQANSLMNNKLVGSGYGGGEFVNSIHITRLLALNSYAWSIFRMGYLGTIFFMMFLLLFIWKTIITIKPVNGLVYLTRISIATYIIFTVSWALGSNVYFRGGSTAIALGVLIGLILSLENIMSK